MVALPFPFFPGEDIGRSASMDGLRVGTLPSAAEAHMYNQYYYMRDILKTSHTVIFGSLEQQS